ncbi:MAG: glycosyltransferase family 4 protein [Anaerolineae bacterium]|uniref:glycosyltransferase family 4 protein n=1 Tax=Candidatus Amarolinea dominans TaxID=3140696 RepID=UPI0031372EA4|nr:glycosyltransferase family 4 protein [Anaerolineae bacterium]
MVGERETGNETYTLSLIRALLALPSEERRGMDFVLYATQPERLRLRLNPNPAAPIRRIWPASSLLRIPFAMPAATLADRASLLHVNYVAPPVGSCPHVVTVHDISYDLYPAFFSPRDRWMLKTLVPLTMRRAAAIITVSQHAKQEIMARYGLPADKIAVTYEAAGEQFRPVTDAAARLALRQRLGLPAQAPYFLALGNLQPRKNIGRLLEAFALARQSAELAATCLVIAGKALWRESEIYATVQQAGLTDAVHFPGYVDDADLPALYSDALAFVYPSLYEGFGLPPLEAMACGTPVICANAASLPEVVGDAALTVPPTDVGALAHALRQVAGAPELRQQLRQRGHARAAQFTWRRCAQETLEIYRRARTG